MSTHQTRDQQRRVVLQHLKSLQLSGVEQLRHATRLEPCSPADDKQIKSKGADLLPAESSSVDSEVAATKPKRSLLEEPKTPMPKLTIAERKNQLEIVQREVAACTLCAELADTRTQTVFGVGDPNARLCFLGEAPGADEDAQGEPFVGRAGQLLTKMIEAMTLSRDDVYILNILKCRPPGNRNPADDEAENCRKFLDRQLEIIQPEYICCLGAVAAKNLLQTKVSVGKLRGQLHDYQGSKVVVTYHPAYLLRNPSAKKPAWEDLKILMAELDLESAT
jgi:uracil-DNA glycosylase family 4